MTTGIASLGAALSGRLDELIMGPSITCERRRTPPRLSRFRSRGSGAGFRGSARHRRREQDELRTPGKQLTLGRTVGQKPV